MTEHIPRWKEKMRSKFLMMTERINKKRMKKIHTQFND